MSNVGGCGVGTMYQVTGDGRVEVGRGRTSPLTRLMGFVASYQKHFYFSPLNCIFIYVHVYICACLL